LGGRIPRVIVLRRNADLGGELHHGARRKETVKRRSAGPDRDDASLLARRRERGALLERRGPKPRGGGAGPRRVSTIPSPISSASSASRTKGAARCAGA
jgi:hypothetical protein